MKRCDLLPAVLAIDHLPARLAEGTPVTTVAIDLGYESPSAFSTMFRRSLGVVPRTFLPRADAESAGRELR